MLIVSTVLVALVVFIVVGLGSYVIALYNSLVQVRVDVATAWSNVDVLLKQRHDELGKLLDTVKSYMGYEQGLLSRITALRASTGSGEPSVMRMQAESQLSAGIGKLFAVAENYPQLRASESFTKLQNAIVDIEQQIARRREFYNAEVNINNARSAQFPDSLVAPMAGVRVRDLFNAAPEDRADVAVAAVLNGQPPAAAAPAG
ncbi:MAG: LemA family protein [Vulcanimicrobiaceae bacterium]